MKRKLSLLWVLTLVAGTCLSGWTGVWADGEKKVTVLCTADLHGRIYPWEYAIDAEDTDAGLAKIATVIKQERAQDPNAILVDGGDTVQDNFAELFNDRPMHPMVEGLNALQYDAWTLGNHEFNFGMDFLSKNIAAFKGNVLAANIYNEDGTRFAKPYAIVERNGVRVAIVGIITPHIPKWEGATPDHFKGLSFKDPVEEAQKVVEELRGQYDVLVGVFHLGDTAEYTETDGSLAIAEACPQFNVIFGAHKHGKTNDVTSKSGVKFIEPGAYGWALAKAVITVDAENKVKMIETNNIETAKVEADAAIMAQFKDVHDTSQAEANKVVGTVAENFITRPDYITGEAKVTTMPTAQIEDTALVDLINQVQQHYAKAEVSAAALFTNESNLVAGQFKKKDVAFVYKYTNTLMGVNITGANLKKYMEWSASYYNTAASGDITISFNPEIRGYNYDMFSGVNYQIDISKASGQRIVNPTIGGQPIEDEKIYKLAVNNYRFGTLQDLKLVTLEDVYFDSYKEYQDNGRVRELIIKYVEEQLNGTLTPKLEKNWSIIGFDFNNPLRETVYAQIKSGQLKIPTSEDGRTPNVKSINEKDLLPGVTEPTAVVEPMPVPTPVPAVTEEIAPVPNPVQEPLKTSTYTVKSGDVLWKIAQRFKITWQELAQMNNLQNPSLIVPGQVLVVPAQ